MTNQYLIVALMLLLGLFPAIFLPILQLMLFIVLYGIVISYKFLDVKFSKLFLRWRYFSFAQFYILFFLNSLLYPVWDSSGEHVRAVALESWSIGLFTLFAAAFWLEMQKPDDLKWGVINWLPLGLILSFGIATIMYVLAGKWSRIAIFTPNPLIPPFWFLVLTMASFSWFFEMKYKQKLLRVVIFFMAGVMAVYGGARLAILAWTLCGVILSIWFYIQAEKEEKNIFLIGTCLSAIICIGGVLAADFFVGGLLVYRLEGLFNANFSFENLIIQFPRLKIWSGAMSIVVENFWNGIGSVNEQFAIGRELNWELWYRAHQTYLSYIIAGGVTALISGLIMQSSVMIFMLRKNRTKFFPAFLGLGFVVTLNCFTDSVFQSAVAVHAFMVITLIFLRVSDCSDVGTYEAEIDNNS